VTALDLGTASRVLTPPSTTFSTVPYGDVDFTVVGASTITPGSFEGRSSIPMDDSGAYLAAEFPVAANHALFIAIAGGDTFGTTDFGYIFQNGGYDFGHSAEQVAWAGFDDINPYALMDVPLPTPLPSGIVVWALVANAAGARVLNSVDGTIGSAAHTYGAIASNEFDVGVGWGYDAPAGHLLGMWQFEGVTVSEADAVDTMSAIVSMLATGGAEEITVAGGWGATLDVDVTDVDVIPGPEVPDGLTAGGSATPPDVPAIVIPDNVPDPVIWRDSRTYPAPVLSENGFPVDWAATARVKEPYARMQITVEGEDVTWINGVPTPLPSYSRVEPFGSYSASLTFPQISGFQARPAWAKKGANVEVRLLDLDGDLICRVFTGVAMTVGRREDDREFSLLAHGVVFAGDLQSRLPQFSTTPKDIGHAIAAAMNATISRRFNTVSAVTTGLTTSVLGGWEPLMSGFVQTLLATALTNGQQWTVKCEHRTPVIALKNTTTAHWTIRNGQPGIDIDLEDDAAESPNLIYGEGVNPDGGRWRNAKYPFWKDDDTPAYPYDPPDTSIKVGTRDAHTDSGDGVSVWQAKAGQPVTGYFSLADRDALMRIQRASGITVDGFLGPQSWAATFNTGTNTGTLDGAWIAPLAWAKEVMPRRWGPDGDDLGANPNYDDGIVPVDRRINFGAGVWKHEATRDAEALLKRDSGDGWAGTITFRLDPPNGSKYEILEGQNVRVLGLEGTDVLLHIASVDSSPEAEGSPVRLTVDERARDYPTLEAIRSRERDAVDPARSAYRRLTVGDVTSNLITFDAESPAGRMPKHAVYGGLWDVRPMPMGAYGSVNRVVWRTSSPATKFSVFVFGREITAATLQSIVGNPLSDTYEEAPWQMHYDALKAKGFLQAYGWAKQPAGYFPRQFNSPDGETTAPVTGRLEDEGSWEYASRQVPWLWVATMADASCYVEGRFYGMPGDW